MNHKQKYIIVVLFSDYGMLVTSYSKLVFKILDVLQAKFGLAENLVFVKMFRIQTIFTVILMLLALINKSFAFSISPHIDFDENDRFNERASHKLQFSSVSPQIDFGESTAIIERRSDALPLTTLSPIDFEPHAAASEKKLKLTPAQSKHVTEFLKEYQRLRKKTSNLGMQVLGTIGLVSGALKVEDAMRENLYHIANELIDTFNKSSPKQNHEKLIKIEETIARNKASIGVLNTVMQFARKTKNFEAFKNEMQKILKEVRSFQKHI